MLLDNFQALLAYFRQTIKQMNSKLSPITLKNRSLSTSNLPLPEPIHKLRKAKLSQIDINKYTNTQLPIISILNIKNKQQEELSNKIKIISQRNQKKLEEKYETIDRWKQRHSHASTFVFKVKPSALQIFPNFPQTRSDVCPPTFNQNAPIKQKQDDKTSKLPAVSKQSFDPNIPDHKEASKKLQADLINRLSKNKMYYHSMNEIEKQINYFVQADHSATTDKRKKLDLRKTFENPQNNSSPIGLFHKKIMLMEQARQLGHLKSIIKKRSLNQINDQLEQQSKPLKKAKKTKSINELRELFMQQALELPPDGWKNQFQSPLLEDSYQQ